MGLWADKRTLYSSELVYSIKLEFVENVNTFLNKDCRSENHSLQWLVYHKDYTHSYFSL